MAWTNEQQAAIDSRGQTLLLSAAAGSGKTAVLVERIIRRLLDKEYPIDITELLVVTFTKAAAAEMRDRIGTALMKALSETKDPRVERQLALLPSAQISTLHAFCQHVIRKYFYTIDLDPAFSIAGEEELNLLRRQVLEDVFLSYYEDDEKASILYPLADMFGSDRGDDILMDTVSRMYTYARSLAWPEHWLKEAARAYDVAPDAVIDDMVWAGPIKDAVRRILEEDARLYDGVLYHLRQREAFAPACDTFVAEQAALRQAAQARSWDDLSRFVRAIDFPRLKSLRKLSDDDKAVWERCKKVRDDVKKDVIKTLQAVYFSATPEEWLDGMRAMKPVMDGLVTLTLDFAKAYGAAKKEKGWIDFSDLEHFCLQILLAPDASPEHPVPSAAAEELRSQYEEVFIDEYQDTNGVQELITRLVSGEDNRFMVGDIKQSIYRFRLARPELFMEKYHSYSLEDSEEQRIDLHKNFRSRAEVLTSVNYIFRQIMGEDLGGITYDDDNALYPGASFPEGADPEFTRTEVLIVEKDGEELEDEQGQKNAQELEALAIAQRIQKMVGNDRILDKETGEYREIGYGDIVILLRSATGWSETFSQVLSSRGIPVYSASRTGYFSAQEVVTLLNYLRVCDNPLQDIPLTGVLHSPIVGCDAQELAMIRSECPEGMIYDSICAYAEKNEGSQEEEEEKIRLRKKLRTFLEQLHMIRDIATYTPIHELIMYILKETGYGTYAKAIPGGAQRGANLHMLVEKAMDYEKTSYRGLFNFIRYIEKLQKYEVDFGEVNLADAGSGAVQIMTIHKSKGLEFPVVFAAGMGKQFNFQDINARFLIHPELGFGVDAIFPERRLIVSAMQKQIIRRALKRESLGEELRVLYVALTRAKEKLIITGSMGNIEAALRSVSRYMDSEETLLPLGVRSEAKSYWSYILPALVRHPAVKELLAEYGIFGKQAKICEKENADFLIHRVTLGELVQGEILGQTDAQMREAFFREWDSQRVYDETIRQTLEAKFGFAYPYAYLEELPVKVGVSELKKRKYADEEEIESALYPEPEIEEIVPAFISGEKEVTRGAARGTAYHCVMECLDYTQVKTYQEIDRQIQTLVENHKMSPEEGESIRRKDILAFSGSELGMRMQRAALDKKLHREQPFVMKVDMKNLDDSWNGDETVLVQGIIDAYFIEGEEIVLVDYKTDRIGQGEESKLIERYRTQLEDYALALERMLHKKVKQKYIYSFALQKAIEI